MRTLKFIVEGQILKQDPKCNFANLVPGSENYLQIEVSFCREWSDRVKVAGFYSVMGEEFPPQRLSDKNTCMIPAEACQKRNFKIEIVGMKADGSKIRTNKVTICQDGG